MTRLAPTVYMSIGDRVMGASHTSRAKRIGFISDLELNVFAGASDSQYKVTVKFPNEGLHATDEGDLNEVVTVPERDLIFFPEDESQLGFDYLGRVVCPQCLHSIERFKGYHEDRKFAYEWKRGSYIYSNSHEHVEKLYCPECNFVFRKDTEIVTFHTHATFYVGEKWGCSPHYGETILEYLHQFSYRVIGIDSSVYLMTPFNALKGYDGRVVMFLNDNGGEINLGIVNAHKDFPSVPYTRFGQVISPETIVYRIMQTLSNDPIDYELECTSSWLEQYRESKYK
ncbi:hypothetical protein [Brevibacillus reuszeri]|uniref:hypothetical protein n=1 Tax=Brevibacillus reuszeri TaxID=54915 RepID=UPI003D1A65AF